MKNAVDTALEKFGVTASDIFAACVDGGSQMVKSMGEVVLGDGPNVAAIRHIGTIPVVWCSAHILHRRSVTAMRDDGVTEHARIIESVAKFIANFRKSNMLRDGLRRLLSQTAINR